MKKGLFVLLLVIVLVCINWFTQLAAQDLSGLSAADKAALIERMSSRTVKPQQEADYRSKPLYDKNAPQIGTPGNQATSNQTNPPVSKRTLSTETLTFDQLQPFGIGLFGGPQEAIPPDDIATASDYVLGPGDELVVALWGQVEKELALTVDREGRIFVPQIGEMVVWGKPLSEFKTVLQKKLSDIYTDFKLSVSLGKIRSIRIYLTGEVQKPGAYTVSSLTSLFNALYLAGGPNANGSMRAIRLMRNGQKTAEVDLYRFLLEGDNSSDIRLESGDAIFVPVAGPRVAIRGKIRRPAIYELKGEQTAEDFLALAGKPTADAYLSRVMLERVRSRDEWVVLDLNLDPETVGQSEPTILEDGDRLTLYSIYALKHNMVTAQGLVKHPGQYERNDSTRISDLLERAQLQPYDVHYKRANLFRRHDNWRREVIAIDLGQVLNGSGEGDILLKDGDSLHIYSIANVTWERRIHIDGMVQNPGSYRYYDHMSVEDLVFLAGSFTQGASMLRVEIARVDSLGEVSLSNVSYDTKSAASVVLKEDDRIYVRQLPQFRLQRTVRLDGEVMYPGEYVLVGRNETLYDMIQRAGGITESAFPPGTVLERASIGATLVKKQVPQLLERSSPVVADSMGNLHRENLFEFDASSVNRIVLDVETLLESDGEIGDLVLQPGDKIFVPPTPSGISVLGAVGASGTIKFWPGKKAKYYVGRAGNFSAQADKKGLRLIRANGEVYSGNGTMNKHVQLGDIVVVPTKIHKERNLMRSFTGAITALAGVMTTVLVIDRL